MEDSSQNSVQLQKWRREQEDQRQYHYLRRRRYLQTERQHQRQRLVVAAMEHHERRRKRYQRALEQQQQRQQRRNGGHGQSSIAATAGGAVQDIKRVAVRTTTQQEARDPVMNKANKLAILTTIKHQLDICMRHLFREEEEEEEDDGDQQRSAPMMENTAQRQWYLFKRLVVLAVYEDILMRLLLRLDSVSSDGDEWIRQQRKSLVKRINGILDRLDQYKQRYLDGGGGGGGSL